MSENLGETKEDYLEAIYNIVNQKGFCLSVDLTEYFDVKKPTVSVMVKKLKETGYITTGGRRELVLTVKGLEVAKKTDEKHRVLTQLLVTLGVDSEIADEDACRMEHAISDESYDRIKEFSKRLQEEQNK